MDQHPAILPWRPVEAPIPSPDKVQDRRAVEDLRAVPDDRKAVQCRPPAGALGGRGGGVEPVLRQSGLAHIGPMLAVMAFKFVVTELDCRASRLRYHCAHVNATLNASGAIARRMERDAEDGVVYQYLLVEMQGARTNILALWSSSIAIFALALALFSTGFEALAVIALIGMAILLFLLNKYMRYLDTVKSIAKGYAAGSRHESLREALRREVLPIEVRITSYQPDEETSPPSGTVHHKEGGKVRTVTSTRRWGALVILIATAFVWVAGAFGERQFGNEPWLWLYWEAILFLAVWTFARAEGLVRGKTEHTIRMFSGWVLWSMSAASILFVVVGPSVAAFTPYLTVAIGIMVAGVGLWCIAAVAWARYEHEQNTRQSLP